MLEQIKEQASTIRKLEKEKLQAIKTNNIPTTTLGISYGILTTGMVEHQID